MDLTNMVCHYDYTILFEVIFVPISHPVVNVFGGEKYRHIKNWTPWKPTDFANSIDSVEKIVRGFGGEAVEVQSQTIKF